MPFGIIMSLLICTVLYIALSLIMTGIAPWKTLGTPEPMITALAQANGPPALINASRFIVALGAVIAMGSVLLVFQLGQPNLLLDVAGRAVAPGLCQGAPKYRTRTSARF
jgi:APA family basic amino acid/polyamine antiporter